MPTRVLILLILFVSPAQGLVSDDAADLILINANAITVDPQRPHANAIAIKAGSLLAVGEHQDIQALIAERTEVIDVAGRTIVPGFNDAHLHPVPVYPVMSRLGTVPCDPESVSSITELVDALRVKAKGTPRGQWIIGTSYQDTKLGRHPTRKDLDLASTEHPIFVGHSSGHVAVANSKALQLAKIDRDTLDPRGGSFDRDPQGEPNGVLRETAKQIVLDAGPERPLATTAEKIAGYARCFANYARAGVTSFQIAGTTPEMVSLLQAMDRRSCPQRVYVMLKIEHLSDLQRMTDANGRGNESIRIGAIKKWFGNSLSGRTCWLYESYADRPGYYGIPPKDSQTEIDQQVRAIHESGFQACIHANGDREIDMLLNAFERALAAVPKQNHRHRIEHCSVVNQQILDRIKRLGLVLATHSYVYEHGDKMEAYGEARWNMMHPNRSAIEMGIPVAGNSDSPVSSATPLLRIQSMVTRRSAEGKTYGAEQRVTVDQAIAAWTMGSAYASFEDDIKGSITPGKLADLVVLSADPRSVAPDQIAKIDVDLTMVGGKIIYRGDEVANRAVEIEAQP